MAFFKTMWKTNSKHQKLSEELVLQESKDFEDLDDNDVIQNENEVVTFPLKYLGSTVVEKITGESISTEAVKNIVKTAKAKGSKKLQRVNVAISFKGIAVTDLQGNDVLKVSIYRISNCSTDPTHRQIFSFISTDCNETMECHAFICSKRKMAEGVTLAVAHAFETAYEAWKVLPTTKEIQNNGINIKEDHENDTQALNIKNKVKGAIEDKLIDFDIDINREGSSFNFEVSPSNQNTNTRWVCFDDDFVNPKPNASLYHIDVVFA